MRKSQHTFRISKKILNTVSNDFKLWKTFFSNVNENLCELAHVIVAQEWKRNWYIQKMFPIIKFKIPYNTGIAIIIPIIDIKTIMIINSIPKIPDSAPFIIQKIIRNLKKVILLVYYTSNNLFLNSFIGLYT